MFGGDEQLLSLQLRITNAIEEKFQFFQRENENKRKFFIVSLLEELFFRCFVTSILF